MNRIALTLAAGICQQPDRSERSTASPARNPRKHKLQMTLAALTAFLIVAVHTTDAKAYQKLWSDGSNTSGTSGCSLRGGNTWSYSFSDYVDPSFTALTGITLYNSPPSSFGQAVWQSGVGWRSWDTAWFPIPKTAFGAFGTHGWPYGDGTFYVYASFKHAGERVNWVQIGKMTWVSGRCYMTL